MDIEKQMKKFLEDAADSFDAAAKAHETQMKNAMDEYVAQMDRYSKEYEARTHGDAIDTLPQAAQETIAAPQIEPPGAAWIKAPDGEELMVLNRPAVVMFMAIFDRLGEVCEIAAKNTAKK